MDASPVTVMLTGAAGQIGYAFLFRIASAQLFGAHTRIAMRLLGTPRTRDARRRDARLGGRRETGARSPTGTDESTLQARRRPGVKATGDRQRPAHTPHRRLRVIAVLGRHLRRAVAHTAVKAYRMPNRGVHIVRAGLTAGGQVTGEQRLGAGGDEKVA
jgi:hypothetical protein